MGVRFPAPIRLARSPRRVRAVPWSEAAAGGRVRRGGLAEFEMRRARGAHVSRRHVRFGEADCAALAAALWARRRGAAASQLGAGLVLGSWRELGRVLRGSVAGREAG